MTKGKKALIIFGGLGTAGAASYFLTKNNPNSPVAIFWTKVFGFDKKMSSDIPKLNEVKPVVQTSSTSTGTSSYKESDYPQCRGYKREVFPIGMGMKGVVVKDVQKVLNTRYEEKLSADGCFGNKTAAAVQRALGTNVVTTDGFITLKGGQRSKPVDELDFFNPLTWF